MICEVLRHPLCKGGYETDGIHGGLVVAYGMGKLDSMMDMSCTMLVLLAVATLMRSQMVARVFRDEDISDASSSSMVVYGATDDTQGGVARRVEWGWDS